MFALVGDSTMTSRLPPAFPATEYSLSLHILISRATEYQIVTAIQQTSAAAPQRAYSTARDQLRAKTPPFGNEFPIAYELVLVTKATGTG